MPGSALLGGERELGALEYEQTRSAEPDYRDDEDRNIACLIFTARSELAEECAGPVVKGVLATRDSPPPRCTSGEDPPTNEVEELRAQLAQCQTSLANLTEAFRRVQ